MSVTRNIVRDLISRKLHIKDSFVIRRITWKNCLGIPFPGNLISVTQNNVFRVYFAIIFGWSVDIAYQKSSWNYLLGAVIPTVDLDDFRTHIWHRNVIFTSHGSRQEFSGESNRTLTPILLKIIAVRFSFLLRHFCKTMPPSWLKVVCVYIIIHQ